jgi:hypothetical protein
MKKMLLLMIILSLLSPAAQAITSTQRFILSAILIAGGAYAAIDGARSVQDHSAVYGNVEMMHINVVKSGAYNISYTSQNEIITQETWKQNSGTLIGLGVASLTAGCGVMASVGGGSVGIKKSIKFNTRHFGF